MSRVLLITYEFPPKAGPGIQRVLGFARGLPALGWDVTVLTVADPPAAAFDEAQLRTLPSGVTVQRAWSLEPTRAIQALRRLIGAFARARRDSGAEQSGPAQTTVASSGGGYSGMPRWVIRVIQGLFVPDEKALWLPWAQRRAQQSFRSVPFDVILASGPPFTALRIAWRLATSLNVPWVADLRDPVYGGYFFRPLTPLHGWLIRRFERRAVASAAKVIVVTDAMRAQLTQRYPEHSGKIVVVTNGFDAEEFTQQSCPRRATLTISYVGRFQASIRPDVFLQAVACAIDEHAGLARDLRIRFVGPRDADVMSAIERYGLTDRVLCTGTVVHREAVAEMCRADALLLVIGPEPESRVILTGKLPEYLAAGRPVLALVPDGVAADVLRRGGASWIVDPLDVPATVSALCDIHASWLKDSLPKPDASVVAEFERNALLRRVSVLLDEVVAE